MSKIFAKFFPLLDYLYIYQVLEYEPAAFLKWFLRHPLKRNLQRKYKLKFTQKAIQLSILSILLMLLISTTLSIFLSKGLLLFPILLLITQSFSPLFILIAHLIYYPVEFYFKRRILKRAKIKLNSLPDLKIIAITGSLGKTSTKEILYTLLWRKFRVVKTPKSFNTPLGIAQTILQDLKDNTEILIIEIGAYEQGDIAKMAEFLKPQIGIITGVAPQHLERFGSFKNIINTKFELARALSENGLAIINGENEQLVQLTPQSPAKVILYGQNNNPFFASQIQTSILGTTFLLHTSNTQTKISIPLVGKHHIKNFLGAAIAAQHLGLTIEDIKKRAILLLSTPHRLEIKKQGDVVIIDNTYNTNPASSKASLELLKDYPGKQKILITPGLIELGQDSSKENQALAKLGAQIADLIIIIGSNAQKDLLVGLNEVKYPKRQILIKDSLYEALQLLPKICKPKAVVLLENDLPDQYF